MKSNDEINKTVESYRTSLSCFLSYHIAQRTLSVAEPTHTFKPPPKKNLGNFMGVCNAIENAGTTFEAFFTFLKEPPPLYPVYCFNKTSFPRVIRRMKGQYNVSNMAAAARLCREPSAFAHVCSDSYNHWMQFAQIVAISAMFGRPLSAFISLASYETLNSLQLNRPDIYELAKTNECIFMHNFWSSDEAKTLS